LAQPKKELEQNEWGKLKRRKTERDLEKREGGRGGAQKGVSEGRCVERQVIGKPQKQKAVQMELSPL
jgi:hypothetical protein